MKLGRVRRLMLIIHEWKAILTESEVILELLLADPDGLVRGDVLLISVGQSDSPPLP